MNHDATHCMDYNPKKCPKDCYRAQLTEELKHRNDLYYLPLSWSHLEGTKECEKKERMDKMSRKVDENGYVTTTTEAKPVEYAPVIHAYWRDTKFSYGECSECGEWTDHYTIARYCVHCGAKMDVVKV